MTAIKQLALRTTDLLDEEALIKEARVLSRRRRRRRGLLVITLAAVACLIVVGVDRFSSATASSGKSDAAAASALACPSARVKLLGVTGMEGGSGHGGLLVRASVSSSAACAMATQSSARSSRATQPRWPSAYETPIWPEGWRRTRRSLGSRSRRGRESCPSRSR